MKFNLSIYLSPKQLYNVFCVQSEKNDSGDVIVMSSGLSQVAFGNYKFITKGVEFGGC